MIAAVARHITVEEIQLTAETLLQTVAGKAAEVGVEVAIRKRSLNMFPPHNPKGENPRSMDHLLGDIRTNPSDDFLPPFDSLPGQLASVVKYLLESIDHPVPSS
jgi:hypothetical protein